MNAPVDQSQRISALAYNKSVCVTAPAGSGKTELLSQRVLTLLARASQPEEILAITFTRKAAAEMHHRIIAALIFARDNSEPTEPHRLLTWQLAQAALARDNKMGWQLLANSGRLKIQTIDSLCASLSRQMPIVAEFGSQPKISENAMPLYQQAIENLFLQLESDGIAADSLDKLLRHLDNDWAKVERLLLSLLQSRDQWLYHIYLGKQYGDPRSVLEQSLKTIIAEALEKAYEKLLPYAADIIPLVDYAAVQLHHQHSDDAITDLAAITALPGCDETALSQWLSITSLLLTKTGNYRKSATIKNGFPAETFDGDKKYAKTKKKDFLNCINLLSADDTILAVLNEISFLPNARYKDSQWSFLEALTTLLPVLAAELKLAFQQYGEVDYSQMSMAALQALGDGLNPTDLMLKLDYQLKHILIDEFQDTASSQYELLKRLVEGWHEYNQANPDKPNTLFIVGDGMQSIYGFREANVGLFLEARKKGVNQLVLEDLPLQVNFRSRPAIVDWINQCFKQAFPAEENLSRGAVKYESSTAFKANSDNSQVKVQGFIGDDSRLQEADNIVKVVNQAMTQSPDGSIAILVRNRSHLNEILPALTHAGIEWQATDINPLSKTAVIIDLHSLTKALLNIADRVSWAALLRTPMIGLNHQDLLHLLGAEQRTKPILSLLRNRTILAGLSDHGKARIGDFIKALDWYFENRARKPLAASVYGIWSAIGGAACVSHSSDFIAIDDYFDLMEKYQQGGRLISQQQFNLAVDKLYSAPQLNNSTLQVMTIHKSKGLEFDTVILPGLDRRPRSNEKSLLMWRQYLNKQADSQLVLSPLASSGQQDSIYEYLRHEQTECELLENTRLLYVAATRAIESLYLSFCQANVYQPEEVKTPNRQSLLGPVWAAVSEQVEWSVYQQPVNSEPLSVAFEQVPEQDLPQRLAQHWQPPKWQYSNPLESFYLDVDYDNGTNIPDFDVDLYPRQLGNIVHKLLEQCVIAGVDFWQTMKADTKQTWLNSLFHAEGMSKEHWSKARDFVELSMTNTLADEKGRWLLSSKHRHSQVEYELLGCFNAGIERKIIDRSFIDENNTHWIIDYKTASPTVNEDLMSFIAREAERYGKQLETYKYYISQLHGDNKKEIRTALYFPAIPFWYETS